MLPLTRSQTTDLTKELMASIMKFSAIKDLKPWKTTWAVHVKVLHTWKQQTGDTMEIILADENVSFIFDLYFDLFV